MTPSTSFARKFSTPPTACERFEADLSALVDGALTQFDAQRVSRHVADCEGCRGFVYTLTTMARMHQQSAGVELDSDEILARFDSGEMFGDLTRRLLDDTEGRLATLLYELGKSLIATGYDTSPDWRSQVMYETQPKPIQSLTRKGQQVAREHAQLVGKVPGIEGDTGRAAASGAGGSRRRARRGRLAEKGLFARTSDTVRGSAAFESGRSCLQECLRLDRDFYEARIFLAGYYRKIGRLDRARQQLQIVQRAPQASDRIRLLATHHLSRVYSAAHQFARAIDMEREVLARAREQDHELLQVGALANVTIYAVKLGRFDEAEQALEQLVEGFPERIADVVLPAFQRAREFRRALKRSPEVFEKLSMRFPALFTGRES